MKPIIQRPDLIRLANLLEQYEAIMVEQRRAKAVSLVEWHRVRHEYKHFREQWRLLSKKALYG